MKKIMMAVVLSLMCVWITACSEKVNNTVQIDSKNTTQAQEGQLKVTDYKNINPEEAKKRLGSEKGIVLLDVRTPEEYTEKHIPGSLLIPVDEIEKDAYEKLIDKNAVIFVYCRSGRRSATASEALVRMGYTDVYNLGGIIDWPYETVSGN